MLTFDFQKNKYSSLPKVYLTKYPQEAQGWVNGVYQKRVVEKNEITIPKDQSGLKIITKDWQETGAALNGDAKTQPTYHYCETTHVSIWAANANYLLNLTINNDANCERTVDILVNHICEDTVVLQAQQVKKINLKIALSQDTFDLNFANHNCSNSQINALPWSLRLLYFSLEKIPLLPASGKLGIYLASDSTAQTYSPREEPQSGWGEELYHQLKGANVTITNSSFYPQATRYTMPHSFVDNRSMGARSSKSFILEGRLASILKVLAPGDYLLIQFGDNDATAIRPNRYVPVTNFSYYIEQYIKSALARKAHPILISPPAQFKFDSQKQQFITTFDGYRDVVRDLGVKYQIPVIDLGNKMTDLLNNYGYQAAHSFYLQVNQDDYPNLTEDKHDITHFQHYGAFRIAQIIASELSLITKSNDFVQRRFGQDYRPVIDQKLQKIYLKWPVVKNADFYVIETRKDQDWVYNSVTTKNESYVGPIATAKKQRQDFKIIAFDDLGSSIEEKVISIVC